MKHIVLYMEKWLTEHILCLGKLAYQTYCTILEKTGLSNISYYTWENWPIKYIVPYMGKLAYQTYRIIHGKTGVSNIYYIWEKWY